jgi:hypothetical protein
MHRSLIVLALALSLTVAGALLAKTPDGQTPAQEKVCTTAGLSRAAFGICNAYCEAQDCDVHPRPSCEKLRKNFQKATGSSTFPCDIPPCGQTKAPQCGGACPTGQTCVAGPTLGGPENGGPEQGGTDNLFPIACSCVTSPPCGATSPTCDGGCATGFSCVALGGPESGGPEVGGPEVPPIACVCGRVQ